MANDRWTFRGRRDRKGEDARRDVIYDIMKKSMRRAAQHVRGEAVKLISVGQPTRTSPSGARVGLDPSRPGEPPHVLSGRLRASITTETVVDKAARSVIGRVGTDVEYAARLELGFVGTDRLGRTINQRERPFLRRALAESAADVSRYLRTGGKRY